MTTTTTIKSNRKPNPADVAVGIAAMAALSKQVEVQSKVEVAKETTDRGHKISKAQQGVPKVPVSVKVNGVDYKTLCDGLKAHGFNVQGDWIRVRKFLKAGPVHVEKVERDGKAVEIKFELIK
jgi:hypothetical protein